MPDYGQQQGTMSSDRWNPKYWKSQLCSPRSCSSIHGRVLLLAVELCEGGEHTYDFTSEREREHEHRHKNKHKHTT